MSGFLFDTCIVRRWFTKNADLSERINALPGSMNIFISSVTLGEIEFGHTSPAAVDKDKQAAFRKWMRETFELPELPITAYTAEDYAKFRRRLFTAFDRKGKYAENREDHLGAKVGVDENDLWLWAQACEHNLTFVSHDHMARIATVTGGDVRFECWPMVD